MPLEEGFEERLEAAVEKVTAKEELEEQSDVSTTTEAADDVGTEAVDGEDGDSGSAGSDGDGAVETTEASAGSGDRESDSTDSGTDSESTKPSAPILSDAILTAAVQHGIPLEDARQFPTEASLTRAIEAVRKSVAAFAPKQEEAEEEDLLAKLPKLDPEVYDEDAIKMWESMQGVIKAQDARLKELRNQVKEYNEYSSQTNRVATQREITEWFDGQILKLGESFKDVLGEGGTEALAPGSSQRAKRDAIANQAAVLLAGYNATGAESPSRDEVFKTAARLVLAEDYAKVESEKVSKKLAKNAKQHIQRGGGQQKKSPTQDAREFAIEELKKHLSGK